MDFSSKHLLISFLAGIALLFILFFALKFVTLPDIPHGFTLYGAVLEETLKFVTILGLVFIFRIKPLATLPFGMGFGFAEGLSHLLFPQGTIGIAAFYMHSVVGFVMSWLLYRAVKANKNGIKKVLSYIPVLIVPMALHAFYNSYLIYFIFYFLV